MSNLLDKKILKELLEDSEQSGNQIAKKFGLNSALINKRIRHFEEKKIIDHYSLIANPEALQYTRVKFFRILPKTMLRNTGKITFLENIGEYLLEKFPEINFLAVAEDFLYGIIMFKSQDQQSTILDAIAKHPHIKSLGTVSLTYFCENIKRLFEFNDPEDHAEEQESAVFQPLKR